MKKVIVGLLLLVFLLALISPSWAQLIDWEKRNRDQKGTTPAPREAAPRRAPALMQVRGTILSIDKRRNRIIIRDVVDGGKKTFDVDERTIASLSRYDKVIVAHRAGSDTATSVRVVR